MKKKLGFVWLMLLTLFISCVNESDGKRIEEAYIVLEHSIKAFKAGQNKRAKELSKKALSVGVDMKNDSLMGYALMNLCRTALREKNEVELKVYGDQLTDLAQQKNAEIWEMYRVHMYAEWARMNGDLDEAAELYHTSMNISESIGKKVTYAVEHFNLAMVEIARGDLTKGKNLIRKYYALMKKIYPNEEDVHGLIPIAELLLHSDNLIGAAEVAMTARRMFKEYNIVPDPADEKPLERIEEKYKMELSRKTRDSLRLASEALTEQSILNRYLE